MLQRQPQLVDGEAVHLTFDAERIAVCEQAKLGGEAGRRKKRVQRGKAAKPVDIDPLLIEGAQVGNRIFGHEAVNNDLPPDPCGEAFGIATSDVLSAATRIPL